MTQTLLPARRTQDLVIQNVGDETLVYDERRHLAFCLNQVAAEVWNRCDGSHEIAQIADQLTLLLTHPISAEVVEFALAQLGKDGLLETPLTSPLPVELGAISRRSILAKAGAGALMMLPVVAAIAAPKAAQAYSGGVDGPTVDPTHDIPADPGEPSGDRSPLLPENPK